MEIVKYSGYECCALENDTLQLLVTRSVGPRIISFGLKNGDNLFAELPAFVTELPNGDVFHFYGGHRLWQAPEDFNTTYIPDDDPVDIRPLENGLLVTQDTQAETGLQKSMEIILSGKSQVTITHRIANLGNIDIPCALWAITQFKTGGVAILPQTKSDTGVLPNRSLALWSYTDMSNRNIQWGREYILVSAEMESPFKVGFPNPRGWLAYWLNGTMFIKQAEYDALAEYYDFGSSSECYCNDKFLELETLGSVCEVMPNETISHVEIWDLHRGVERPQNEQDVRFLVEKYGLE
jgi:hypothetical protein